MSSDKTTQAQRFLKHMTSGKNQPMTTSTDVHGRINAGDDDMVDTTDALPTPDDFGDLTTPGQLMDAVYANLITELSRLSDRVDFLTEIIVQRGWIDSQLTESQLDEMIQARYNDLQGGDLDGDEEKADEKERKAYRRAGQDGVGYVVRETDFPEPETKRTPED